MNRRVLVLGAAGAVLGIGAEGVAFGWDQPLRWVPDLAVGWTFIACGLMARGARPESRTGSLMVATGFAWFLGNFSVVDVEAIGWLAAHAVHLHRGPLIHCVLSFPSGRLTSRLDRGMVAAGYLAAVVPAIAGSEGATIALGALLVAVAVRGYVGAVGAARRARAVVVRAAIAVGVVLSGGAAARLVFPSGDANDTVLLAYESGLCAVAIGLFLSLRRAGWERAAVTDLVVELAGTPTETLRDALARALGDPTIEVGYWAPDPGRYVDAVGRAVEVSGVGADRTVTPIELDGRPLAVLVHDPAVLDDPGLIASITAATRLTVSNARLQAEVRTQVVEVEASRRRLVEAGDEERRRLERRLREGAAQRLTALAGRLEEGRALARTSGADGALDEAAMQLQRTLDDLHELSRGLHPTVLREAGLAGALRDLGRRSPVPIEVAVTLPALRQEVEAAAYFVCSEALANMAKHAHASSGSITADVRDGRLVVEIADDGVGGADGRQGSGLRGLADRVDAAGGRLVVDSPEGGGTRVAANLPLGGDPP